MKNGDVNYWFKNYVALKVLSINELLYERVGNIDKLLHYPLIIQIYVLVCLPLPAIFNNVRSIWNFCNRRQQNNER